MIALDWGPAPTPDIAVTEAGQIARDDGLRTAVLLSLFLDARASAEDPLPDGTGERRGWLGDALAPDAADRFGSRLWLLSREKQTEGVRARSEIYGREALAWLVTDGLASAIDVAATWRSRGVLALRVRIVSAPAGGTFDETFEVSL